MNPDDGGPQGPGADPGRGPQAPHAGTRELLAALANGDPADVVRFRDVFAGLGKRSFGMLLFVATLPAWIPIPGMGGAVSGPLTILIGAQLLIGLRTPWLPRWIARRGPHRSTFKRFEGKLSPWMRRLERLLGPRLPALLDHRLASALSGLLLIGLGVLLALPIPFTNYIFAVLLLLFALALLERDGALMGVAWLAAAIAIVVFGLLGGNLAARAGEWMARWS